MKYLFTNLSKYGQYLYTKSYKTLKKEMKKDLTKRRDITCSWIARLNIAKLSIPLNLICGAKIIPTQILGKCFIQINKVILNFIRPGERTGIFKRILKRIK